MTDWAIVLLRSARPHLGWTVAHASLPPIATARGCLDDNLSNVLQACGEPAALIDRALGIEFRGDVSATDKMCRDTSGFQGLFEFA